MEFSFWNCQFSGDMSHFHGNKFQEPSQLNYLRLHPAIVREPREKKATVPKNRLKKPEELDQKQSEDLT